MLKFLGRGSAFNTDEGNTSAYYLKDDVLLLIDCGTDVFKKVKDKGLLDACNTIYVAITHLHSDHAGSLSSVIEYCYYKFNKTVTIIFPSKKDIIDKLKSDGVDPELYNIHTSSLISDKLGLSLRAVKTVHVDNLKCYSYTILFSNGTYVYYSGDTSMPADKLIYILNMNNSIIYHDCCVFDYDGNVHTSLRLLCEAIPEHLRYKVYCMHFDYSVTIDKAKECGFNIVEIEK